MEITLKVLEWEIILRELARYSTCETGREKCLTAEIYSDINVIKLEQKRTSEAKYLLDKALYPPLSGISNIKETLSIAKTGQALTSLELIDVGRNLAAARYLKAFLNKHNEEAPLIYEISGGLFEDRELEESILEVFDDAGNVLDAASSTLRNLRISLRDQTENLKSRLNSFINSSETSKYLQDPVYTLRGDRYVLPIKIEHKSHVPGIMHDLSSSGATVFIEPQAIVQLNNRLKEIELGIEAEIRRILAELSARVAKHHEELGWSLDILTEIDFIFARAKYSIAIKAMEPEINENRFISLKNVRHPVLLKVLENVVPNDIEIGKNYRVMVITGPNTGGKTVILKTVGVCTLLARAGMHVPADEASIYPFVNIFADIGDEQSITQSLSTFSGHIKNIVEILNNTNENTLILLDEVGAGTDPLEGTVLAEAILENIRDKGARALVTTHFSELKAMAYTKDGFYNASVEFDTETLSPTYKLLMGLPGRSNAINIAQKLGLDENIVEKAKNNFLNKKDTTGQVLESLHTTQQRLTKDAREIEEQKAQIEELKRNYDTELEKIRSEKKKIINIYRKKFDTMLSEVSRETISKVREVFYEEAEKLKPVMEPAQGLNIGDVVFIKSLEQEGTISGEPDKNDNVQVQIGVLKTTVKKYELFKPKQAPKQATPEKKYFCLERTQMSNTLDLRGERVEEGLNRVELYLDQASLANLSPVYIIHGHGTGKLRQAIRDYLKKSSYVKNFRPGEQGEGGDGVTVVELK